MSQLASSCSSWWYYEGKVWVGAGVCSIKADDDNSLHPIIKLEIMIALCVFLNAMRLCDLQ